MPILILLRYGLYGALACVLAYGGGYWRGKLVERDLAEQASAKVALQTHRTQEKIIVQYVDRIQKINVPVPVVRERLVDRLCNEVSVRSPGTPDAGAASNAGDRLATDLRNAQANKEQLKALIEALRPQVKP